MSSRKAYEKRIGISLYLTDGRITIYKATLEQLGFPEYYRFLYNPEEEELAVEACSIDAKGAHRMPQLKTRNGCEIKSTLMVRLLYKNCGWDTNASYRLLGSRAADKSLVNFKLSSAEIINLEHTTTKNRSSRI